MAAEGICNICGNLAEYGPDWAFPGRHCPRCGDFDYDASLGWRKIQSPDELVRLSGWVREQNAASVVPVRITQDISRRIARMPMPRLRERANRALSVIARKYPDLVNPTEFIKITADLELQGISYSRDQHDAMVLINILIDDGFFKGLVSNTTNRAVSGVLTPKGLLFAEELGVSKSSAAQAFVAMWFDESLRDAWTNGFDPGIRAAGFHPVRIDNKDYVGGISDEIMAEIRRSRFVVADYTGQRNGVYFEAGFALGLGLTVIPTCRAGDVDELGFDIKHLNTLLWNTPAKLAEGLNRRIRAVMGAGPDADPS
jgi:hypothetical protein